MQPRTWRCAGGHARSLSVIAVIVLVSVLSGCSDDSADEASPTEAPGTEAPSTTEDGSTSTSTTTSTSAPATSTTGGNDGCAPTPDVATPDGAATIQIVDVDGDGNDDTAWLAPPVDGQRRLGVTTASGAASSIEVPLVGPVPLQAMAADADESGPVEIFVSDNRSVLLHAFTDCTVVPITNPEGETYTFDLGFRGTGTGVGCVDADGDGMRELVGLNRLIEDDGDGVVSWTRTIIRLDGTNATNGPTDEGTFDPSTDEDAIELLSTVSCGDRTIADGVTEPRE